MNDKVLNPLSWHLGAFIEQRAALERLPHAILIEGAPGIGKSHYALALSALLLCEARPESGPACGQCAACAWFAAGNHPDFRLLNRLIDDDGKQAGEIKVDQIRALSEFLVVGAHRGGRRVVVIDPADAMNTVVANALLKTLEEPSEGLVFLLVSARPDAIAATIRSRCQVWHLPTPDPVTAIDWLASTTGCPPDQARGWLAMAGGSVLHAAQFAEPARAAAHRSMLEAIARLPDTAPVELADALQSFEPRQWLPLLQRWVIDIARSGQGAKPRYFPQMAERLSELAARSHPARLDQASRALAAQFRLVSHPLNPRMVCEASLESVAAALSPVAARGSR